MAKSIDLNDLFRDVVVHEVRAALAPYRDLFERMAKLMGPIEAAGARAGGDEEPTTREPRARRARSAGRTRAEADAVMRATAERAAAPVAAVTETIKVPVVKPVSAVPPIKRARPRLEIAKVEPAVPVPFSVGQRVVYRIGDGEIEATVVAIAGSHLVLDRVKDGKRVKRPAAKVEAA